MLMLIRFFLRACSLNAVPINPLPPRNSASTVDFILSSICMDFTVVWIGIETNKLLY